VGISSGDPPTLNPYENLTYLSQHPAAAHYSRLLRSTGGKDILPGDNTKLEGDVAAKLPEQPDDVTYVFPLKTNVKFHDKAPVSGRAFTAKDVTAVWEIFRTKSQNAPAFNLIDKVEAPDEKTVKFTLKEPYAPFLMVNASSPEGLWLIAPETFDSGKVQTDPIGTGPFIFRQWEKGVALRWDRNPAYFDSGLPYFAKVEASLNNDPQRIIAALQAGELDWSLLNGLVYEDAKKKLDQKGSEFFIGNLVQNGFYFNFDVKPWGDKRVRQALSMALDRDGYLKVQDGAKKGNWHSHVPAGMAPYYMSPRDAKAEFGPNAKYFEKNIAEAKKLLAAAGFENGLSFKLTANVDRYGAEAKQAWELFAQTLPEAGFKPELVYQEYGAYIQSTFLGKITDGCAVGPLIGSPRDPDDIFTKLYASVSPRHNWGGTPIAEMPQLDTMFAKQRRILKVEDRIKEVKEIQRVMAESMLLVPYHGSAGYAYAQPWMQNFFYKDSYAYHTESVGKAWFTDDRIKKG
jgi:peptide/nickel transport system substrate-binding protein